MTKQKVAPFTGAWIETRLRHRTGRTPHVAPFTGAWIETINPANIRSMFASPLSQGRGLKQQKTNTIHKQQKSPLSQGRGLKLSSCIKITHNLRSPLSQGRGLKLLLSRQLIRRSSRPFHRGVD